MNDHDRFHQLIEAYLSGGLEPDERDWMRSHAAGCASCAAELAKAETLDASLGNLFAAARPPADFEDRLIQRVRWVGLGARRLIHPAIRRITSGVAAALLLGTIGYVANGMTSSPATSQRQQASRTTQPAQNVSDEDSQIAYDDALRYPENWRQFRGGDGTSAEVTERKSGLGLERNIQTDLFSRGDSDGRTITHGGHAITVGNGQTLGNLTVSGGTFTVNGKTGTTHDKTVNGPVSGNWDLALKGTGASDLSGASNRSGSGKWSGGENGALGSSGGADYAYKNSGALAKLPEANSFKPQDLGRDSGVVADRLKSIKPDDLGEMTNGSGPVGSGDSLLLGSDNDDTAGSIPAGTERTTGLSVTSGRTVALGSTDPHQPAAPDANKDGPAGTPPPQDPTPRENLVKEPPVPPATDATAGRKIIRNGEMEFEVESFDPAVATITKLVAEEGGYVSTTNSDKLPNGKMKGTVIIRVAPDHLDRLVAKLRLLGDLKSQRIGAEDVTKHYTDVESALKAAHTMEGRLLDIIKNGKGEVKDLVEAEKQLGVWREKIDQLEGEIRYYNNLVSLSTLSITVSEKAISTPSAAIETEQVNMAMETDDVDKKYADARKAIDDAKGRIIQSDMKKYDAGQLAANIVAEVAPEAAPALEDRLKQLGSDATSRVVRFDVERKQTTQGGTGPARGVKVEQKETRLSISIYNLTNVAPRQTTNITLACEEVEKAYAEILALIKAPEKPDQKPIGRVVANTLNASRSDQVSAEISLQITSEQADIIQNQIRAKGETMAMTQTENPDAANTTASKRGIVISLRMLATVAPREARSLAVAARAVPDAYDSVLKAFRAVAAKSKAARVITSQLNEQDKNNLSGTLVIEVAQADEAAMVKAIESAGQVVGRQVTRSPDIANTVDTKLRFELTFIDQTKLDPRETTSMNLAVAAVPDANKQIVGAVNAASGIVRKAEIVESDRSHVRSLVIVEIPRNEMPGFEQLLAGLGDSFNRTTTSATENQNTVDTRVRYTIEMLSANQLAPRTVVKLQLQAGSPEDAADQIAALGSQVLRKDVDVKDGRATADVTIDVPLASAGSALAKIQGLGTAAGKKDMPNPQVPEGKLARARFEVTITKPEPLAGDQGGIGDSVRKGLATSVQWLLRSLTFVIVGLCIVLPAAIVLWGGWRLGRRMWKPSAPANL